MPANDAILPYADATTGRNDFGCFQRRELFNRIKDAGKAIPHSRGYSTSMLQGLEICLMGVTAIGTRVNRTKSYNSKSTSKEITFFSTSSKSRKSKFALGRCPEKSRIHAGAQHSLRAK